MAAKKEPTADRTSATAQATASDHGRLKVLLGIDLLIVVLELCGLVLSVEGRGLSLFEMYTQDSNILNLVACSVFCVFAVRELRGGPEVPGWVHLLAYAGACCLMLTFLVVILVLAPMMENGYQAMLLQGSMLFNHLLCPLITLVAFLLGRADLPRRRALAWALVPTVVYAVVLIALNLARVVEGPYPFLRVYDQPWWASILWVVAIFEIDLAIAAGLLALRGRLSRR